MPPLFIDAQTIATSPAPTQVLVTAAAANVGSCYDIADSGIDCGGNYIVLQEPWGTFMVVDNMPSISQQEIEFQQQKDAFMAIPPIILAQYQNKFVVSYNGEIMDSDFDLPTLTARFFNEHGDMPVFVARIGNDDFNVTIDTPFFD